MPGLIDYIVVGLEILFWYCIVMGALRIWLAHRDAEHKEIKDFVEKVSELMHKIQEERHGDQYYWFDAHNDQFLAQGANTEEIVRHLKSRFPGHVFFVTDQNDRHLYISEKTDWMFKPVDISVK